MEFTLCYNLRNIGVNFEQVRYNSNNTLFQHNSFAPAMHDRALEIEQSFNSWPILLHDFK